MEFNEMKKGVMKAAKDYKKSDHLMVRKTFGMKDVVYKKSAPSKELWKSEVAFDVNFCLLAAGAILAAVLVIAYMSRMLHSVKALSCRMFSCRKK